MSESVKYPVGVQTFESLRNDGFLYIDKTALIYKMISTGRYYFFSRPRRFGKSLLISTLKAYFQGKKELFKGLKIEQMATVWKAVPVFHLDLNNGKYDSVESLLEILNAHLCRWEALYGAREEEKSPNVRFAGVIERAHQQTGERVAILVDEYDKPLLQNIGNDALQEELRSTLRAMYSVMKGNDKDICFGLLTGVSKYGKMSVFSDLNNLKDISMDARYVELCGITESEIIGNLSPQLQEMALKFGISFDEMLQRLRTKYDGYHFAYNTVGLYNPYSLLNAFDSMTLNDYWFETGTPSFLVKILKQTNYNLNRFSNERQTADALNSIENAENNPVPMLYQSGYLTIKGYDEEFENYQLGFPNLEVEKGFIRYLLPCYTPKGDNDSAFFVEQFVRDVRKGDVGSFLKRLQTMFSDNSYAVQGDKELYFQNTMYVIFKMMGFYVEVERTTNRGRIDMIIKTADYIYIIEIKLDGSADEALRQINEKGYAEPFAADSRKKYKIGINFVSDTRGIGEWKVAE